MINPSLNSGSGRDQVNSTEISFDIEAVTIVGLYSDELSAHRAKKVWIESLENHFLLDNNSDYLIALQRVESEEELKFTVKCHFNSACARYAFWRITNNQAPEAQQAIELAHLPVTSRSWFGYDADGNDSSYFEDADNGSPLILDHRNQEVRLNKPWFDTFEDILQKLVNTFDNSEKKE